MAIPDGRTTLPITSVGATRHLTPAEKAANEIKAREAEYAAANPVRRVGMTIIDSIYTAYMDYLHLSGTVAIGAAWWYLYPYWARYRHHNLQRYRKEQIKMRHWMFSENIPKVVNPNESRVAGKVFLSFLFLRWCNSYLTLPLATAPRPNL